MHCSPCLAGSLVAFAGCDGFVRLVDLKTGKQRAAAQLGSNFGASPVYANGVVFVASMSGDYAAVAVSSGKLLWHVPAGKTQGGSYGSPGLAGDALVIPSRNQSVCRLARGTGKLVWTFALRSECDSSPLIISIP